jgi:hypothetical protein
MSQLSGLEGQRRWKAAHPEKVKEFYQRQHANHGFELKIVQRNRKRKISIAANRIAARIGEDDDVTCMARILFGGVI